MFLHYLINLKITIAAYLMAYCMWDLRIHLARYEAALLAQVSIL